MIFASSPLIETADRVTNTTSSFPLWIIGVLAGTVAAAIVVIFIVIRMQRRTDKTNPVVAPVVEAGHVTEIQFMGQRSNILIDYNDLLRPVRIYFFYHNF